MKLIIKAKELICLYVGSQYDMTGSNRTNLTTLEVFSKDVGAENLITCYSAEISGFIDFEIKLLAYLMRREERGVPCTGTPNFPELFFSNLPPKDKGKIRAETARIVFAAVRRKPVSEPIDFLSRDGRRRCRRRRQTLGNTRKMIVAESVQLEALGWNTPFSTASKRKKILVIVPLFAA